MSSLVALVLLAELVTGPYRGRGVRPAECGVLPGERGANVWERAKIPELRRYCDFVASAAAKLAPGSQLVPEAVRLADEADALVPGRAAPMLLKGRALGQLARYPEALQALRAAQARDPRALDDPAALLAWARALESTGDVTGARDAYRTLLPRAESLTLADRAIAYLGAGMLAMYTGPAGLGESLAILRQGRRESQDLLRAACTFALALALDRADNPGEATAVLVEVGAGDAGSVLADARVLEALGGAGRREVGAMAALAAEVAGKREAARSAWQAYRLAVGAGGAWDARALAHERALAGATRRP